MLKPARGYSRTLKTALLFAALVVVFAVVATRGRNPDLSYLHAAVLTGSEEGNYYAIVAKMDAEARHQRGRVDNLPSAGSVENIARLAAAKSSCGIQFALVQDGIPWPQSHPFELIGRLPLPEAFVVLGRNADATTTVAGLRGKRVGIGPAGSGTDHFARQLMAQIAELNIRVSSHSLQDQITLLERGELDLGAMVIDPDARLVSEAVRERKLQIVDIAEAETLAHRLPSARAGVIRAGYYDPIRNLPPADKHVLQVDTLVISNGCARESATQGFITALTRVFPDFVRINRVRPNRTGLEYASAARSYFDNDGPDRVGEYLPWFIDIMPTARWLQLVFAFSLLFGAQAAWHRFRLWRLDANRVRIEDEVSQLFGPDATVRDIETLKPGADQRGPDMSDRLDAAIHALETLQARCRRQSVSMLVPMGQEMSYRYQERLMSELLHALRVFRERLHDQDP
jgi:TRAP-type uncharacterized transport system substrate-binding protein